MESPSRVFISRFMSHKTLAVVLGIQTGLIAFRIINITLTGFMTSDEANYILRSFFLQPYGNRYFFDYQLVIFFRIFGVDSLPTLLAFLPFYMAFWSFLFLTFAYKTVGLITENRLVRSMVVFSLPFMVAYSLLSTGVLSEMPGLATCMVGIYFWVRYFKRERRWYFAVVSSLAFVAAAYSREPYIIFPAAGSLVWILSAAFRRVNTKHAIAFVALALLVAAPTSPLYGSAQTLAAPPAFAVPSTTSVTSVTSTISAIQTITNLRTYTTNTSTTLTNTVTTTVSGTLTTETHTTVALENMTATRTETSTLTSTYVTTYVSTATGTPNSVWLAGSQFGRSALLFAVGMLLGWGPVQLIIGLVALVIVGGEVVRRRFPLPLFLLAMLSFGSFYLIVLFIYNDLGFLTGQGISYLIRLTNPTVPAFVLLSPFFLEKLGERKIKVLAVLLLLVTAGAGGLYVSYVQSNFALPYNVLGFSNPTAQFEARNYFVQNTQTGTMIPVVLSWDWEAAQIYLKDVGRITVFPTIQDSNFSEAKFESLRPQTFYVLSESPLRWDNSSSVTSNVQRLMGYSPPPYLTETYATLFGAKFVPESSFKILSVQEVFASPTGHLLEIHVSWP